MKLSRYPVVYIQIPKTGTGSVNDILLQSGGHRAASWMRQEMGEEEWFKRFKFAFVRHPFERFISTYGHFKLQTSVKDALNRVGTEFVPKVVLNPQSWFLDEEMNYIGRFENFADEWNYVATHVGITERLGRRNRVTNRITLSEHDKKLLYDFYREDFDRFGYTVDI